MDRLSKMSLSWCGHMCPDVNVQVPAPLSHFPLHPARCPSGGSATGARGGSGTGWVQELLGPLGQPQGSVGPEPSPLIISAAQAGQGRSQECDSGGAGVAVAAVLSARGSDRSFPAWPELAASGIAVLPRLSGRTGLAQGAIVLWGRVRGGAGGSASIDTVTVLSPPWPRLCVLTLLLGRRARWWHGRRVVMVGLS